MKKRLPLILTLIVAILLTSFCFACKKKESGSESESQPTEESQSESNSEIQTPDFNISIGKAEYTVREDETILVTATVSPSGSLQWTASDSTVLGLVPEGNNVKVLGKKAGVATLTATCGQDSATCSVTVTPSNGEIIVVESEVLEYDVELNGDSVSLQFGAFVLSSDGSKTKIDNANISYTVSNPKLVLLENGVLTAKRHGSLSVTASYSGVSATVPVTVYDKFISNTSEWQTMINTAKMGEYYMLDDDIDFSGVSYTSRGADTSSGSTGAFRATLNGKNHTVKNITLNSQTSAYVSIFGKVYNAKISNISFEKVVVSGSGLSGAGLAVTLDGRSAVIKNVYLDITFDGVPTSAGALIYHCYGGKAEGVVAKVETPTDNANMDNVKIVKYLVGATTKGVYVLAQGEIETVGGFMGYTSKIDMAWDINDERVLDGSWTYLGGTQLPVLNKNI